MRFKCCRYRQGFMAPTLHYSSCTKVREAMKVTGFRKIKAVIHCFIGIIYFPARKGMSLQVRQHLPCRSIDKVHAGTSCSANRDIAGKIITGLGISCAYKGAV